jgi:hypothetical protein
MSPPDDTAPSNANLNDNELAVVRFQLLCQRRVISTWWRAWSTAPMHHATGKRIRQLPIRVEKLLDAY